MPLLQQYLPNSKVVVIEQNEDKLFNRGALLKLEYDLDKVFLCNREKYLNVILDNETKHQKIVDLDDLRKKYFTPLTS